MIYIIITKGKVNIKMGKYTIPALLAVGGGLVYTLGFYIGRLGMLRQYREILKEYGKDVLCEFIEVQDEI